MRKRIQHVITGLNVGGAELVLSRLVSGATEHQHAVVSLGGNGPVGKWLSERGVTVEDLGMRRNPGAVRSVLKLSGSLARKRPDLVQTWLYHADLAGGLAARRARIPVVWNLRQTDVGRGVHKLDTRVVIRLCAWLSRRIPHRIVCGSSAAMTVHQQLGYDSSRMTVIRNGVDTRIFQPDPGAAAMLRSRLGLTNDEVLVGRVGRYHAQKDYRTFVKSAARIADAHENVVFVMVGNGVTEGNRQLMKWIQQEGLERKCRLMGQCTDIADILAGLDVLISSSSFGEGFPNVIAEAMSCGVPCVATDIGDSADIVGDPGRIAAPCDPDGLARGTLKVLNAGSARRIEMGERDRARIVDKFDVQDMIRRYEALYHEITGNQCIHGTAADVQ